MPACRENRRRRQRRRQTLQRQQLARLAARLPLKSGSRPYFEAYAVRVRPAGRKRQLIRWRERPTPLYRQTIAELIELTKDIPLPEEVVQMIRDAQASKAGKGANV